MITVNPSGGPGQRNRIEQAASPWRETGVGGYSSTGSTTTNFPIDPLSRNLIRPVILANRVSSLPRPTFSPGFTRVPRWRTMIVPPGTTCPPNALNPSRCEFESRPFRDVPCPFLCAIKTALSGQLPVSSFTMRAQCARMSRPEGRRYCYFFFVDFFAAFFGADFFFAFAFGFASDSSPAVAFTFFGFASFLGTSGALKLCPPNVISAIRTEVNGCRCPRSFLYCFLRL